MESTPALTPLRATRIFGSLALRDARGTFDRIAPLQQHMFSALEWLARAQNESGNGGFSYGYSIRGGWKPSYRETTGYIIGTLLDYADSFKRPDLEERALRAAEWLVSVQNPDGSISNPAYGSEGIVFDTGQVLFGFLDAYARTSDQKFIDSATRAGQWLHRIADSSGLWTRSEHFGTPHVYNSRTAWALVRLAQTIGSEPFLAVARHNLDWAVNSQQPSGFFADAAFRSGDSPYTHNISYTICGLQESGWLLDEPQYLNSARRAAEAALGLLQDDGFLPGSIDTKGNPVASYACLTGTCQFAIVWAKLFNKTAVPTYRRGAEAALSYVLRRQQLETSDTEIRGAIAGSFPVWGRYAPLSYPNWATKFFLDAALLQHHWSSS